MSQLELQMASLMDEHVVVRQPSLTRALIVCADIAGFEDKKAASAAGVDPATWSRIKTGQANFPHENYRTFQQKCGNYLPLQWLARECGFELVHLETELERQLRIEREARVRVEMENQMLRDLLVGRRKEVRYERLPGEINGSAS